MLKNNIKVGDYVRIDGYISKIGHIKKSSSGKTYAQWKQPNGMLASGCINIIEKSSSHIIDLIKVGDYVNGDRIDTIEVDDKGTKILGHEAQYSDSNFYYWNINTHVQ